VRAIILEKFGGLDSLVYKDIREPEPKARHVVVQIKAFGICEIERPDLSKLPEAKQIDAVLDLVGNSVMLDSLAMLRRGGSFCLAGWLGGLDPIPDLNPLLQMASGVYLTFFGSFVFGTLGFPLSDVPLQQIAADAASGRLDVKPVRVFRFDEIREAHRIMEANEARGKMVVVHD
jgi:NADPH2:quinone reductase